MYRTLSGRETELASTIRRSTASPCWSRDNGNENPSGESLREKASSPTPSVPAGLTRDETA